MGHEMQRDNTPYESAQAREEQQEYNRRVDLHNEQVRREEMADEYRKKHGVGPYSLTDEDVKISENITSFLISVMVFSVSAVLLVLFNILPITMFGGLIYSSFSSNPAPVIWYIGLFILGYFPAFKYVRSQAKQEEKILKKIWFGGKAILHMLIIYAVCGGALLYGYEYLFGWEDYPF